MASLRETKNRIKSVKNTEKITRAMKMVAASKLRRAQDAVFRPRPYAKKLSSIISNLANRFTSNDSEQMHPLLSERDHKKHIELLVLSSDRGLCGAFNSSAVRMATRFLIDNENNYDQIIVSCIGKKAYDGLTRAGVNIRQYYKPNAKNLDLELANSIATELCERFLSRQIDGVYIIFNEFKSAINQKLVTEQLLPVERSKEASPQINAEVLYEPNRDELLQSLVPKYFATRLYQSFLESYASEQGARMTAMENATRNAKEMTEKLTLEYNRARQAAITKELMEIIGGAEAL